MRNLSTWISQSEIFSSFFWSVCSAKESSKTEMSKHLKFTSHQKYLIERFGGDQIKPNHKKRETELPTGNETNCSSELRKWLYSAFSLIEESTNNKLLMEILAPHGHSQILNSCTSKLLKSWTAEQLHCWATKPLCFWTAKLLDSSTSTAKLLDSSTSGEDFLSRGFLVYPDGKKLRIRPRTLWRDHISWLAWGLELGLVLTPNPWY